MDITWHENVLKYHNQVSNERLTSIYSRVLEGELSHPEWTRCVEYLHASQITGTFTVEVTVTKTMDIFQTHYRYIGDCTSQRLFGL